MLMVAFSAPAMVAADTLYKCEGPGGTTAYTNRKDSFKACKAVASYASAKPAPESAQAKRPYEYRESVDVKAHSSLVTSSAPMLDAQPSPATPVAAGAQRGSTVMTGASTSKAAPRVIRGSVYRVDRSNGVTEYTNVRPSNGKFAMLFSYISTCVACDVNSKIDFSSTRLNVDSFRAEVASASLEYGVDASLLRAVMHAESAFNPMALSNKGAQGLMQLMPGTANDLGVLDAFDVAQNIRGGAKYLAQMLKNFNGDERLATAAYNAGPGAVQRYGNVPPYAETQVYVERVATLRNRYRTAQ